MFCRIRLSHLLLMAVGIYCQSFNFILHSLRTRHGFQFLRASNIAARII